MNHWYWSQIFTEIYCHNAKNSLYITMGTDREDVRIHLLWYRLIYNGSFSLLGIFFFFFLHCGNESQWVWLWYYLSWIHTWTQSIFITFLHTHFGFWGHEGQNATLAVQLCELKKVQLYGRFTLVTQDFIGHLETFCRSIFSMISGIESEWKWYSSPLSVVKTPVF